MLFVVSFASFFRNIKQKTRPTNLPTSNQLYTEFIKPGASFQQHGVEAFLDRTKEIYSTRPKIPSTPCC